MEVLTNLKYHEYLLDLLTINTDNTSFKNQLLVSLYMTLLSLNGAKYKELYYQKEIEIIEDYLRKINNLKVKIQLKRKETEINNLSNEIKEIYQNNTELISKYNQSKLPINAIIDSLDPNEITSLIDKLTKEKINKINKKDAYDAIRNNIINNIFSNEYYIEDDSLYIDKDNGIFIIELNEFYKIFDYLLNIDNYSNIFLDNNANRSRILIVADIIKSIISPKKLDNDSLIPVILTSILSQKIPNYTNVDTSNFIIENIKITELYSLAGLNKPTDEAKTAKWNKILIPNEYLYSKIKELTTKGMYYYQNDKFILENIINNTSDFKISINNDKMKEFLISNLKYLTKKA